MAFRCIEAQRRPSGVGVITLRRPEKLNALSIDMRCEISLCLGSSRDADDVLAVVITGAGRAFSAGFDLDEFKQPERYEELFQSSARYHRDVWYFPKPTIAAVNGTAVGGGLDLAALCDIRICSEKARFAHPELKYGAPPLFTPLRWIVGDGVARDLCLSRRSIDAQEAHRIRLVSEVVGPEEVLRRAEALAGSIAEAPPEALRYTKSFMSQSAAPDFEACFAVEHDRSFRELLLRPGHWLASPELDS